MNSPIVIGMLLDGKYPSDIRVRKEAESLVAMGFKVIVICPAYNGLKQKETHNKVIIERIGSNYSFNKKGVLDIRTSLKFVHPWFKKNTPHLIKKYGITHLHVHDLPLAKTALLLKQELNCKVILDLHENYPEGLKTWFAWKKSFVKRIKNKIFFSYDKWLNYEKEMCHQVDHIIAVIDEMKERLITLHQVPENKITLVSNTELKSFQDTEYTLSHQELFNNHFVITYIGGFGPHRGLDTAILAIVEIKKSIPNALLLLVGSGSKDVTDRLNKLVQENKLQNHVTILGQQPFEKVWGFVHSSDVNIIPHVSDSHTDNTIPHKLFQILSSKKPILVSSCKPLERIVKEHDAGYVFNASDPLDFAQKIITIRNNYPTALKRALNGHEAITYKNLNWEYDAQKLSSIYGNDNG